MPSGAKKRKAARRKQQQQQQQVTGSSDSQPSDSQPNSPRPEGNGGINHDPVGTDESNDQNPSTDEESEEEKANPRGSADAPPMDISGNGEGAPEEECAVQVPIEANEEDASARGIHPKDDGAVQEIVLSPPPSSEVVGSKAPVEAKEEGAAAQEIDPRDQGAVQEIVLSPPPSSEVVVIEAEQVRVELVQSDEIGLETPAVEAAAIPAVQSDSVNEEVIQVIEAAAVTSEVVADAQVNQVLLKDSAVEQPRDIEVADTAVTAKVTSAPLIHRRATLWNCCGLLDVFRDSQG